MYLILWKGKCLSFRITFMIGLKNLFVSGILIFMFPIASPASVKSHEEQTFYTWRGGRILLVHLPFVIGDQEGLTFMPLFLFQNTTQTFTFASAKKLCYSTCCTYQHVFIQMSVCQLLCNSLTAITFTMYTPFLKSCIPDHSFCTW